MTIEARPRKARALRVMLGLVAVIASGCAVLLLVGAVTSTLGRLPTGARWSMVTVAALSHAAIYFGLTLLFGRSLLRGRTPLVTLMASQVHALTPRVRAYTRRVTILWTVFGLAQLGASALLLALAPLRVWSIFVNGLDLPLVLTLFAAEYAYRRCRFPAGETATLADTIRVTRSRVLR